MTSSGWKTWHCCTIGSPELAAVSSKLRLSFEDLDHYWHSIIPSIGFKHQYVIHSILSLSALHMVHTNLPNKEALLQIASEHRGRALEGFAEDLQNVGVDNSTALFANSALTFFYVFASFSINFANERRDSSAGTTLLLGQEWFSLVRDTAAVFHPVHLHVRNGPLRCFIELHEFEELDLTDYI